MNLINATLILFSVHVIVYHSEQCHITHQRWYFHAGTVQRQPLCQLWEVYFMNGFHYWLRLKSYEGHWSVAETQRIFPGFSSSLVPFYKLLMFCSNNNHILGVAVIFTCCLSLPNHAVKNILLNISALYNYPTASN